MYCTTPWSTYKGLRPYFVGPVGWTLAWPDPKVRQVTRFYGMHPVPAGPGMRRDSDRWFLIGLEARLHANSSEVVHGPLNYM